MKFIGIILLLLTSIFLIACSANQASNKISNSELENLASKYGGVYVFNEKFAQEIDKQEQIRDSKRKEILERIKTIPNKNERNKKMREILKLEFYNNPKMQQILSNGKPYYTSWIDYERQTNKTLPNIDKFYEDKIKEVVGQKGYEYASVLPLYLYIDDNGQPKYISISVGYDFEVTKYGLYGDEGRGFALSRKETRYVRGGNKFILNNNKFEKVK
ncbi:tRNA 2-selenouridine synthase [Campylobacter concisus]|uniref:tRNA 2-selenouridine synthase n=1 Tax=Campylobacter concisus TaxID=199 RepID=UPI00122C80A7|nr:tRNA 2-selenouridine synthase [Campylobacter concisus]